MFANLSYLLNCQAKAEEIFGTHSFANFYIGTIQGADGEGAIKREFHVAGARGLIAGSGDLLGKVGGRVDYLRVLDVEIGKEYDFEILMGVRIIVDFVCHRIDQLDYQLGHKVAWCCLTAEYYCSGRDLLTFLDAIIERDDMQHIEKLAFILMHALRLNVKEACGINLHSTDFLNAISQTSFATEFDLTPELSEEASSARVSSAFSLSRLLIHESLMAVLMSSVSLGLASTMKRLGVTPLVLLLNFSGQSS